MLDKADDARTRATRTGPRLDFQEHLADLDAAGLVERIDTPINKDTELHPLVRWQFVGGVPEDKRKAFIFTNVTDAKGRKYDIPVVVGALSASPEIYAMGMGRKVEEIGDAWMQAINHPIAPVRVSSAPCQEVVITGDDLKAPGGARRIASASFNAWFRFCSISHRDFVRDARSRDRRAKHGHLSRRVESSGPARGAHGGARGDRRRRLSALAQIPRPRREDADRHRHRRGARSGVHRAAKARH